MKNTRFICLVLCLMLVLQAGFLPARATEDVTSETAAEETTLPEETTMPEETTSAVIPDTLSGDASATAGCKTIEAQKPLITDENLLKTAKAAFLYERNSGTLLYSKNADEKMYPASLTKVMTCMLALENLKDLNEVITVSESAISGLDPDGSNISLQTGEEISVENLLYALMVSSANDAGAVLAERVSGSQEAFVEMMNQKAKDLGCVQTHFANVHGLHDENHYTTARDLARIMLAAVENPVFRKFDSTASYTIPATNMSEERELLTTNFMIGTDRMDTFYDERVTGGKTGFTNAAGRCLMCTASDEEKGISLLSVVLGTQEEVMDDGYTITYYGNFEETSVLLKVGFENFEEHQLTMEGQALEQFPVTDGKNAVAVGPASELHTMLPADYEKSDLTVKCELTNSTLKAPVSQGETVGTCRVWYKDICVGQTGLVSLSKSEYRVLGANIFSNNELQRENLGKILKTAGIVFLVLVAVMVIISAVNAVRNAVIYSRRRRRRNERRRENTKVPARPNPAGNVKRPHEHNRPSSAPQAKKPNQRTDGKRR